jgi:hypothetical protein
LDIIKSIVQGVLIFITEKIVAKMLHILELGITKLLIKPAKDKDKERRKEREAAIYYKIISPKALVD